MTKLWRYLLAALLVRLADEGARVVLVLLALRRTDSAGVGGLLIAALLVPHVVAAPAVGRLTDRVRVRSGCWRSQPWGSRSGWGRPPC